MRARPALFDSFVILALTAGLAPAADASWPHDPNNGNVAVCTAAEEQNSPTLVSDGAGGVIVVWFDYRNGESAAAYNPNIYAQRISAAALPQWTTNGAAVCAIVQSTVPSPAMAVVADGAGGAIVAWQDHRRSVSYSDIYAQRISADGVPLWTTGGILLRETADNFGGARPTMTTDGAGGAIVAWEENSNIRVQRINADGVLQWIPSGVAVYAAPGGQPTPSIARDGAGGAIVTWSDRRTGVSLDAYAQRINGAGLPLWTTNGVALCLAAGDQTPAAIVTDGSGGAIVTWFDHRPGTSWSLYAQRVSAAGLPLWISNGVALCTHPGDPTDPVCVSDDADGAIIAWTDFRSGISHVYAQRITAGGLPQWAPDGVALCTAPGGQSNPVIAADGAGGAVVTWTDLRSLTYSDIYAQRVSAAGLPQWANDGIALCTASGSQSTPLIVSDSTGSAIVAWVDHRSGIICHDIDCCSWPSCFPDTCYDIYYECQADIYAQRIDKFGYLGNPEPSIASARDVPDDQGGRVKVSWNASYLDADPVYAVASYRIWRSAPPNLVEAARAGALRPTANSDEAAKAPHALFVTSAGGSTEYWEYLATQPAAQLSGYSYVAATTDDSIAPSNQLTLFMVEALAASGAAHWFSAPASGYSVDNLAPATPSPFSGTYGGGVTRLHWGRSFEPDFRVYQVYRGSDAGFVPEPGNLVIAKSDTGYVDAAGQPYFYKLAAVDTHGNESPAALLQPADIVAEVGQAPPSTLSMAPPLPNPARGEAAIAFNLPRAGRVSLAVYDATGRRVRRLREGAFDAGLHSATFDLRDDAGRRLPNGLYLVRLQVEGRSLSRRLVAFQ